MLKKLLLATSVLFAAPAFAQDRPAADTQAAGQATTQNQTAPAAEAATPADPATAAQATPQANPAPATQTAQPTPSQQPAATQDQVAQAVERDFGTYDKDSNGTLSQTEFGTWISTLRKASEPSFQPGTPVAETWVGQAFAATDTDHNRSIDKTELTTFLTPKAS